jgi:hypothetical protein
MQLGASQRVSNFAVSKNIIGHVIHNRHRIVFAVRLRLSQRSMHVHTSLISAKKKDFASPLATQFSNPVPGYTVFTKNEFDFL